jgi:hypothetical protein
MSMSLTLVVLLVASDDSTAGALSRAAQQALGNEATIIVRAADHATADDEVITLSRALHADACAVATWSDAGHREATLHVYIESSESGAQWRDRRLRFEASDAPAEKGRTLGFALASMLPEAEPATPSAVPEATEAAPAAPPAPGSSNPSTTAPTPHAAAPQKPPAPTPTPAKADTAAERPTPLPEHPRRWLGAVDATVGMTPGLGDLGPTFGGALAGQWYLSRHFSLRAGAALRSGQLERIEASATALDFGLGLAWRTGSDPGQPLGFGLRLSALALDQVVSRPAVPGRHQESHARWLPAADLMAEGLFAFSQGAALVAGVGGRLALGKTTVLIRDQPQVTLDSGALLLEVGLRAQF